MQRCQPILVLLSLSLLLNLAIAAEPEKRGKVELLSPDRQLLQRQEPEGSKYFRDFNAQRDCINPKEEGQTSCGSIADPIGVQACLDCFREAQDLCLATSGSSSLVSGCNPLTPSPAATPNAPPQVSCHGLELFCKQNCESVIGGMKGIPASAVNKFVPECKQACSSAGLKEACIASGYYFPIDSSVRCVNASNTALNSRGRTCHLQHQDDPDAERICFDSAIAEGRKEEHLCRVAFGPSQLQLVP